MNIISAIDCFTGYGITGYNIWKNIYDKDSNTTLFPIANANIENHWDRDGILKSINNQNYFNKNKPCLKVWHANDLIIRTAGNSKYGCLCFFEIDKISDKEKIGYSIADTIFAPSKWAKNILESNGIKTPIVVCPQGVDTTIFNGELPSDKTQEKYVFINIGKWEIRKGHDILVDIFNRAFNVNDNVELWMLNTNPFLNEEQHNSWIRLYKESPLGEKIKIFPRLPDQKTLSRVISYSDCGIFPSRAEGWNNEAIELLAMNKPIILTDYSAHTEYANTSNSFLVNIQNTEPAQDDIWFDGSGNWASIADNQIDQFIEYMRYVYSNNIRNNPNGIDTTHNFSWDKTSSIIMNALNE